MRVILVGTLILAATLILSFPSQAEAPVSFGHESMVTLGPHSISQVMVLDEDLSFLYHDGSGNLRLANTSSDTLSPGKVIAVSDSPLVAFEVILEKELVVWIDEAGKLGLLALQSSTVTAIKLSGYGLTALALRGSDDMIFVGDENGSVYQVQFNGLMVVGTMQASSAMITQLALDREGDNVAVGDAQGRVTLVDIESKNVIRNQQTYRGWITSLAYWSFGGTEHLVVGASIGELLLYEAQSLTKLQSISLSSWSNELVIFETPDLLLAGLQNGNLEVLEPLGYRHINHSLTVEGDFPVYELALFPDGLGVARAGAAGAIEFLALDSDGDLIGDRMDPFPADGSQWNDADGDGWGDNLYGNAPDDFPTDASAHNDTDKDGFPDAWNPGSSRLYTTTGLSLDRYPLDPGEWRDSDGDGVGDNSDPLADLALITKVWQIWALFAVFLGMLNLGMHSGYVYSDGRGLYRQLSTDLDPPKDPVMALAMPTAVGEIRQAKVYLGKGRVYKARKALARLNQRYIEQSRLKRQVTADLKAIEMDLEMWLANGYEPPGKALRPSLQALDEGRFEEVVQLVKELRRELQKDLWHQRQERKVQERVATYGSPLASRTVIPAPTFDWHLRQKKVPQTSETDPSSSQDETATREPAVVNINISDSVINRSDLRSVRDGTKESTDIPPAQNTKEPVSSQNEKDDLKAQVEAKKDNKPNSEKGKAST